MRSLKPAPDPLTDGMTARPGRRLRIFELAAMLRRAGIWVIEDDLYSALAETGPPPLATLLPEQTVYVTLLSKSVAPGLRVGYLVAPDAPTPSPSSLSVASG